ncbi:MAG: hypothetical protein LBV68_08220 [Spirochaetaceae bacterium]|jgi:hypothetical protein|nr:hypothetical protein [Spirochaetaceae bacterium]
MTIRNFLVRARRKIARKLIGRELFSKLENDNQNNLLLNLEKKIDTIMNLDKKMNNIINALLFSNTIIDSVWLKYKSFSPGGWAMDNAALFTLYRILNDMSPQNILEFGLGQSSKMIHQYAAFDGGGGGGVMP